MRGTVCCRTAVARDLCARFSVPRPVACVEDRLGSGKLFVSRTVEQIAVTSWQMAADQRVEVPGEPDTASFNHTRLRNERVEKPMQP
jgi:hypothetical protein